MSELNVYYHELMHDEYAEFYLKYEADAVIAEKNKEIAKFKQKLEDVNELVKASKELLKESQKMHQRCADNAIKKIRHHKYKRCLAMAKWCSAELGMLVSAWDSKIKYYKRWQKRWQGLAKKFKEVNNV